MSEAVVIAIIGILGVPVTVLVSWLVNKRKSKGDVYASIAGASQDAVETMTSVMVELRAQVQQLTLEANNLKEENRQLRGEIANLHVEIMKLRVLAEGKS